jgi:Ca2+-transporting ATPase
VSGWAVDWPPRQGGLNANRRIWHFGPRGLYIGLLGTLLVLDALLPGRLIEGKGDLTHGRTMAFATLTLFHLFNVFNACSDHVSAFHRLFSNLWLWGSVVLSFGLSAAASA